MHPLRKIITLAILVCFLAGCATKQTPPPSAEANPCDEAERFRKRKVDKTATVTEGAVTVGATAGGLAALITWLAGGSKKDIAVAGGAGAGLGGIVGGWLGNSRAEEKERYRVLIQHYLDKRCEISQATASLENINRNLEIKIADLRAAQAVLRNKEYVSRQKAVNTLTTKRREVDKELKLFDQQRRGAQMILDDAKATASAVSNKESEEFVYSDPVVRGLSKAIRQNDELREEQKQYRNP